MFQACMGMRDDFAVVNRGHQLGLDVSVPWQDGQCRPHSAPSLCLPNVSISCSAPNLYIIERTCDSPQLQFSLVPTNMQTQHS